MPVIRIPKEHWATVWETLIQIGPIHRISKEYIYSVSERHIEVLKNKALPFTLETDNPSALLNLF